MQENLNLENFPKKSGVYFFMDENDKVVYVGSSKNLYSRLFTHRRNISSKSTDLYKFLRENPFIVSYWLTENYRYLEQVFIDKHKPRFNKNRAHTGIDCETADKKEYYRAWHSMYREEHNLQMRAYDSATCFYEGEYMKASNVRYRLHKLGVKNPCKESRKYIVAFSEPVIDV